MQSAQLLKPQSILRTEAQLAVFKMDFYCKRKIGDLTSGRLILFNQANKEPVFMAIVESTSLKYQEIYLDFISKREAIGAHRLNTTVNSAFHP